MPFPTLIRLPAFLLLAGLSGSCREEHASVRAADPGAPTLSTTGYVPDPTRELRGYSFGGGEVAWYGSRPPERILYGELGRTPRTLLYLNFNQDLEQELAGQPGWS